MKSGWTLQRIVEPLDEPVTLEELKAHCRVDVDVDDDQLTGLLIAARVWAESYTRRAFLEQTWELTLDRFPSHTYDNGWMMRWFSRGRIELPRPPFIGLNSFSYLNDLGTPTAMALSLYGYRTHAGITSLVPARDQSWPMPIDDWNTVSVVYRAGYQGLGSPQGDPVDAVPQPIKQAIKLHAEAHYDRDPQNMNMLISAAQNLLATYRVAKF